jgi:hypothetical protein
MLNIESQKMYRGFDEVMIEKPEDEEENEL